MMLIFFYKNMFNYQVINKYSLGEGTYFLVDPITLIVVYWFEVTDTINFVREISVNVYLLTNNYMYIYSHYYKCGFNIRYKTSNHNI